MVDSENFHCHNCSMSFRSLGLLEKHKDKFCIGSCFGDSSLLKENPRSRLPKNHGIRVNRINEATKINTPDHMVRQLYISCICIFRYFTLSDYFTVFAFFNLHACSHFICLKFACYWFLFKTRFFPMRWCYFLHILVNHGMRDSLWLTLLVIFMIRNVKRAVLTLLINAFRKSSLNFPSTDHTNKDGLFFNLLADSEM